MEQKSFEKHLTENIIPFWNGLKDEKNGGFCGLVGSDLKKDFTADKGVILHSRILWFYSNADAAGGQRAVGHGGSCICFYHATLC